MHGVGLAVEFDVQNAGGGVGAEVGAGVDEAADEAAGVVGTLHDFPGQLHQRGLGPVGNEFDGVDEELAPPRSWAKRWSSGRSLRVMCLGVLCGRTWGFPGPPPVLKWCRGQFALALFVTGGGGGVLAGIEDARRRIAARWRVSRPEVERTWLSSARQAGLTSRVVSGSRAGPVLDQTVQPVVLAHVFEEVFLMPSGEHGGGLGLDPAEVAGAEDGGLVADFIEFANLAQPEAVGPGRCRARRA